jgi:hypothetical protein
VLAVTMDTLGVAGGRVWQGGRLEVWARPSGTQPVTGSLDAQRPRHVRGRLHGGGAPPRRGDGEGGAAGGVRELRGLTVGCREGLASTHVS